MIYVVNMVKQWMTRETPNYKCDKIRYDTAIFHKTQLPHLVYKPSSFLLDPVWQVIHMEIMGLIYNRLFRKLTYKHEIFNFKEGMGSVQLSWAS